jgi:hypothetical protein
LRCEFRQPRIGSRSKTRRSLAVVTRRPYPRFHLNVNIWKLKTELYIRPGLPDGIFSSQKIPIWVNFVRSFNGEDVGIFYGNLVCCVYIWYILWSFGIFCIHLVYFMAIWYFLYTFGIFYDHLVYLTRFDMLYLEESGNPAYTQAQNIFPCWVICGLCRWNNIVVLYTFALNQIIL